MADDPSYSAANHSEQGGSDWEVGGTLNIQAAGTMTVEDGAGVETPTVADASTDPGAPCLFSIPIAAGALGDTDVVVAHKIRIIDAWLVLTGAGVSGTTLTVQNGASAVSNAMAASGSSGALVRATTWSSTYHTIAAGGTLRVASATGATQPAAIVYVLAIRQS